MNKIKHNLTVGCFMLLLLFTFIGCSDDEQFGGNSKGSDTGHEAYLAIKTAVSSALTSVNEEDAVHTIRVIAYESGTYTSPLCNAFFEMENNHLETDAFQIKSGRADVYIIVNETQQMHLDDNSITVSDIHERTFEMGQLSDPISTTGLPMYAEYVGDKAAVVTKQHTKEHPLSFTAEVERIMAKLTLHISNNTLKDILLDKVKIKSLPSNSWLYPTTYTGETIDEISATLVANTDHSSYDPVSVYIPEYMVADITKRSYLYITGKSDKGIDCEYTLSLGNGLSNYTSDGAVIKDIEDGTKLSAEDFNIVRNTHYEITVDDIKGYENNKLTFIVGIKKWDSKFLPHYEGGTWVQQPISSRIPINGTTSFTAKFTHTEAPKIMYKWYRSQYKQTAENTLPSKPTIELLKSELLLNGETSTLTFEGDTIKPYISGDIYCKAAPVNATNFRESKHATLMVIGDWDGEGGTFYPDMQNWKPAGDLDPGTSYLMLDNREKTYGGKKIYRVKLMADGNWWMIQDLTFSEGAPTPIDEFVQKALYGSMMPGMGDMGPYYGACCSSDEPTGGYLYSKEAAIADKTGLIVATDFTKDQENIKGLCPEGWHLPANKNGEWNREWKVLLTEANIDSKIKISSFGYYDSTHFNAYTEKLTTLSSSDPQKGAYISNEKSINFHGGYTYQYGISSIGLKIGIDSQSPLEQTREVYLNQFPNGGGLMFYNPYFSASIRCIRDYTK